MTLQEKSDEARPMWHEAQKCTECGNTERIFDPNRGEVTCARCGLVISGGFVDPGPEWRAFDPGQHERRTRVGSPLTDTIHDRGLSTFIGRQNRDAFGKEISSTLRAQIIRLRRWQSRMRVPDAVARNLNRAMAELGRVASSLSLSKNLEECAARIYRNAVESRLIRGHSIEGVVAAAVYAACRKMKVPRTLVDIASATNVGFHEIGGNYRRIAQRLGMSFRPTEPADFIARFRTELGLSAEYERKAVEITREASRLGCIAGRGPTGVAAAAIYLALILGNESRTQREVARVAQVTEVTIRNRYKELSAKLHLGISRRCHQP